MRIRPMALIGRHACRKNSGLAGASRRDLSYYAHPKLETDNQVTEIFGQRNSGNNNL